MLLNMQSRTPETVSAESVSQAGAGGLLSAVGVVELALGFGAAGWSHRAGVAAVVLIGAALLIRGTAAIVAALHPPRLVAATQQRHGSRDAVGTTPAVPDLR
jgi:uncharacterized membrane protein HdeD (DUF308 family)